MIVHVLTNYIMHLHKNRLIKILYYMMLIIFILTVNTTYRDGEIMFFENYCIFMRPKTILLIQITRKFQITLYVPEHFNNCIMSIMC